MNIFVLPVSKIIRYDTWSLRELGPIQGENSLEQSMTLRNRMTQYIFMSLSINVLQYYVILFNHAFLYIYMFLLGMFNFIIILNTKYIEIKLIQ